MRKAWDFLTGLPALAVYAAIALSFLGAALWGAYRDGARDANAKSGEAVAVIEGAGLKAQSNLNAKTIDLVDSHFVAVDKIKERSADARRQIEAVGIERADTVDGLASRDVLSDLIACRDIVQRLRDENERARRDYLDDNSDGQPSSRESGGKAAV